MFARSPTLSQRESCSEVTPKRDRGGLGPGSTSQAGCSPVLFFVVLVWRECDKTGESGGVRETGSTVSGKETNKSVSCVAALVICS